MRTAFFLLLRLICYPALAIALAALVALAVVSVNGECPPLNEAGVTCATKFSQALADFGLGVALLTIDTGLPLLAALGGLIFLVRDAMRWRARRRGP